MSQSNEEQILFKYVELLKTVDMTDRETYDKVTTEMAQIGQPIILPLIAAIYSSDNVDGLLELKAIPVLRGIVDEKAADTLIKLIKDFGETDCLLVYAAARGLYNLTPRSHAFEPILRALSHCCATGVGALYPTLTKYGDWAKSSVLKAIMEGDKELQDGAFLALEWFILWGGWKSDIAMLIATLKAPRLATRLIAIDAIAELKDMNTIPLLEEIQKNDIGKRWYKRTGSQAAAEAIDYIKSHQSN